MSNITFYVSDLDTQFEDLSVSFSWLKSESVIPNQIESVLPSNITSVGDKIQGVLTISDGDFTVSATTEAVDVLAL